MHTQKWMPTRRPANHLRWRLLRASRTVPAEVQDLVGRVGLGLAATGAAVAAYRLAIRPWHSHWGATEEEAQRVLPGNEEVQHPFLCVTRAITIQAPPEAVWPWLAQMGGYTRAGWYAYDWIDNAGRPSARRILPKLQHLAVGDVMPTSPDGSGFRVQSMEEGRSLVLVLQEPRAHICTAFVLDACDEGQTRFITRLRAWFKPGWRETLYYILFEPGDFIMMRKMLLSIKQRSESTFQAGKLKEAPVAVP